METHEGNEVVRARLFKAIEAGDVDTVRELLELDTRLASAHNPEGASALIWATYYRQPVIGALFIEHGAKPDVFEASAIGLADRVKDLLASDRSLIEAYSYDGWTALHLAAHFGSLGVMRTLLANGADHRAVSRNSNGNQPLQAATAGRQREAVAMLLQVGAEVDARSEGGFTALHLAAANGDAEIVRALLDAGAHVDVEAKGGRTPMDFAVESDREEVVSLLEAGLKAWKDPSA